MKEKLIGAGDNYVLFDDGLLRAELADATVNRSMLIAFILTVNLSPPGSSTWWRETLPSAWSTTSSTCRTEPKRSQPTRRLATEPMTPADATRRFDVTSPTTIRKFWQAAVLFGATEGPARVPIA
jgi:hypothetical protein